MNRSDPVKTGLRPVDMIGLVCAFAWLLGVGISAPCDAKAQMLSVAETEAMVRIVHYEGAQEESFAQIGPEGCARLVEMLVDPGESKHHAQILMAIGGCNPRGGFEAIRDWADKPRVGEIDRATFRAWQALPYALGYLAAHDRRAIDRLEGLLNTYAAPSWTFRHHRGARLVDQARRSAATGLAFSGMPEAQKALGRAKRSSSDASLHKHVEKMRGLHGERAVRRALLTQEAGNGREEGLR
jgi:hypothetical protein